MDEARMTTHIAYGDEPAVLDVAPDIRVVKVHRHYMVHFPFNRQAVDIMRMIPTAHWDRANGWAVGAHKHDTLLKALQKIDTLIGPRAQAVGPADNATPSASEKPERVLVLTSTSHEVGEVIRFRRKDVTIERLGTPFIADQRFAKWGKSDLVGQSVRYAYHHPATPQEIDAWNDLREARRMEREAAPDPEPSL